MPTLKIADLITPSDRQRKIFDDEALMKLAESIAETGLLNAVSVRMDGKTLVAGERRVRAITTYLPLFCPAGYYVHDDRRIPLDEVPYTKLGDDDAYALMAAEYAENAFRADLTWQENAEATAALHRLRQAKNPTQTVAETAQEIHGRSDGWYQDSTKQAIVLSDHLGNPEVAKAKSAKEAFKILVRQEETQRHSALAALVGKTYSASEHRAKQVDCREWMMESLLSDERFDVILTDPPYGMGADNFGDAGGKMATITHSYDDSYENWQVLMGGVQDEQQGWCDLSYLVCKPQAHAYVFCDFDRFHELKLLMEAAGWYVFRTPIINVKENGRVPLPDQGPRRVHEYCLYAIKGQKHTTGIFPDVIHSSADEQMGHGAQKPVSLYVDLLRRSARPGDLVLDAFSGSGTIFPAATECKVRAVGLESSPASYGKGLERLRALIEAETAQPELPGVE